MKIQKAKPSEKRYELQDGDGLLLEIMPTGNKYWRYRFTQEGKRKRLKLGEYPALNLRQARAARDAIQERVQMGLPPIEKPEKKQKTSFQEIAEEWLEQLEGRISNVKEKKNTRRRLELHVFPFIGAHNIAELTAPEVLEVLRRLEVRNTIATAKKIRQIISQIFRYGVATGKCTSDPTFALRDALKPYKPQHMASVKTASEITALLHAIDAYPRALVRLALQFSVLTFCRPGEVRQAEWSEIDLKNKEWRIPEEKMKMRRTHLVPLPRQAIEILEKLRLMSGHGRYIFPSNRAPHGDRPMSENTALRAIRKLGYTKDQMTAHGFRSMASTRLNEKGFNKDWIELQLAHVEGDSVRAAYNYAEHLKGRRKMMQWWADYLDELRAAE